MRKIKKHISTKRVAIVLLVISSLFVLPEMVGQQTKTNIVLIMADDLGFEAIKANGGTSYNTPFIDKLVESGIRFENAHSQPICTPSRVQIMTGKYNVRNYTKFGVLDRSQTTFGNLFQKAGYKTVVAGKWQLGKENDSPQYFGFDESCLWQHQGGRTDEENHDTRFSNPLIEVNGVAKRYTNGEFGPDIVSDYICDFIEKNKGEPFLAYYPMLLTHCPFIPTPDSGDWDPKDMGSLTYKGDPAYFGDMVTYMDKMVGKIVTKLESLGLRENTLIIFTGDNGTDQPIVSMLNGKEYPGGKSKTTDNGTHVPLIVSWKGTAKAGVECDDLIDFSDILPTICEAANVPIPEGFIMDGRSFIPQLLGEKGNAREWIYSWYNPRGKNLKEFTRNKTYKLYTTGEFYNVKKDFFEQVPLDLVELGGKEKKAYKNLKAALNKYAHKRN
jgi:arylsulfatase A